MLIYASKSSNHLMYDNQNHRASLVTNKMETLYCMQIKQNPNLQILHMNNRMIGTYLQKELTFQREKTNKIHKTRS